MVKRLVESAFPPAPRVVTPELVTTAPLVIITWAALPAALAVIEKPPDPELVVLAALKRATPLLATIKELVPMAFAEPATKVPAFTVVLPE